MGNSVLEVRWRGKGGLKRSIEVPCLKGGRRARITGSSPRPTIVVISILASQHNEEIHVITKE